MAPPDDEDQILESEVKRRKLRKGTRSCWECKRRKVRCTYVSESDEACITCRRRGAKCVSQELPEEPGMAQNEFGAERIMRVEALLERLVNTKPQSTGRDGAQPATYQDQWPTPASDAQPYDQASIKFLTSSDTSTVSASFSGPCMMSDSIRSLLVDTAKMHQRCASLRPSLDLLSPLDMAPPMLENLNIFLIRFLQLILLKETFIICSRRAREYHCFATGQTLCHVINGMSKNPMI